MGWFGKFGGWDYCAGFGKYLWWNGKEVQEEGEESLGIGWVGGSFLAQEVPWSDGSSAEEQFEAIKKDEQFEKDLESGAVDTLSKMETKQAQDMLTKSEENMAGISEEKRKMVVWSLMWMAEQKKGSCGRKKKEGRRKKESS